MVSKSRKHFGALERRILHFRYPVFFRGTSKGRMERCERENRLFGRRAEGYAHKITPLDQKGVRGFIKTFRSRVRQSVSYAVGHSKLLDVKTRRYKRPEEVSRKDMPVLFFFAPYSARSAGRKAFGVSAYSGSEEKMSELEGGQEMLFRIEMGREDYKRALDRAHSWVGEKGRKVSDKEIREAEFREIFGFFWEKIVEEIERRYKLKR